MSESDLKIHSFHGVKQYFVESVNVDKEIYELIMFKDKQIKYLMEGIKASEAELGSLKKALGESINYRECNLNYTQALDALCKAELLR
jgi:hypothetical protein